MFEKGKSGNPAGRRKGSPNRVNAKVKEMLSDFVEKNFKDVTSDLKKLKKRDRVKFFFSLLPYLLPRLQNISADIEIEKLSDEDLDNLVNKIIGKTEDES